MSNNTSRVVTAKRKARKCVCCGNTFKPAREDARYCSPRCRQRARRARDATDGMAELDREIERARLEYWRLIAQKARALGRSPAEVSTSESQYVDTDGNVWLGGVMDGSPWRYAGKLPGPGRPGWSAWGLEAAGPPWSPPGTYFERAILGRENVTNRDAG